jgi:hypothetical protein
MNRSASKEIVMSFNVASRPSNPMPFVQESGLKANITGIDGRGPAVTKQGGSGKSRPAMAQTKMVHTQVNQFKQSSFKRPTGGFQDPSLKANFTKIDGR